MHAWEGNPRLDETSEYRSQALSPSGERSKVVPQPAVNWRVVAVFAAGSLLGVPFIATGTAHAAWLHIVQTLAFLRQ